MKIKRIHPVFGLLGILCFLGIFNPLFYGFVGFFGFYWWGLLSKEISDERLESNLIKSKCIICNILMIVCLLLLLGLTRNFDKSMIIAIGSFSFGISFVLAPAIAYYCDKLA